MTKRETDRLTDISNGATTLALEADEIARTSRDPRVIREAYATALMATTIVTNIACTLRVASVQG
jgi:hypothetical protein